MTICVRVWPIENLNQKIIVVEVTDLAPSNKKSVFRVLHVDDDFSILDVSKQILMEIGNFEVETACCVEEALTKLETNHYDAVISDYEMPLKNGLQFLQELREKRTIFRLSCSLGKAEKTWLLRR